MTMTAPSNKRAVVLLAAFAALSATGLAAAQPAELPPSNGLEGLRPLERLAGALRAGRSALDARAAAAPLAGVRRRSVGQAIAGDRPAPDPSAAVFPVSGPAGYGEAGARFGAARAGHSHQGQDVFAPPGTPLVAVRDGVVVETGDDGGRGNYVALYSPLAHQTYVYLHMDEPSRVRPGRRVRAGRRLGGVGCTGSCFGDHLHFEVRRGRGAQGKPIDPLPLLERWRRFS